MMLCIFRLRLTILSERIQTDTTGNQRTARASPVVGIKIATPVLPLKGVYTSEDARSCVNDDYFDFADLCKSENFNRKKDRYWRFRLATP